jgi:hypothetical protein
MAALVKFAGLLVNGVHSVLNWALFLVGMAILIWGVLFHSGWLSDFYP